MAAGSVAVWELPAVLEASEPPEVRGLRRDHVRLLVPLPGRDAVEHARFDDLPRWLGEGDVLVVNTSATLNAALRVASVDGIPYELHLSTPDPRVPDAYGSGPAALAGEPQRSRWIVELRVPDGIASLPSSDARPGMALRLPGGGSAVIESPYSRSVQPRASSLRKTATPSSARLWRATLDLPESWLSYLRRYGEPIRYGYVRGRWPSSMYQTVFAVEPGSAEMPSAGRPFTPELVMRLVASGVQFAPVVLHTGVSSLEDHEPPYAEYFHVPATSAALINVARASGHRVIAVGTTAVRAVETATSADEVTRAMRGWTELVITPERRLRAVDGLITGLHEPRASHLMMLAALVRDRAHLDRAYAEAIARGYRWHEFGDAHLILNEG